MMFNLCKIYKGDKPLKVYPTWEPSEHGEKTRIVAKYGKVSSPPRASIASLKGLPSPLDLNSQHSRKCTLLTNNAKHEPSRKKYILTVKDTKGDLVHLPPTLKVKCMEPYALATRAGPKFSMSPPL